MDAVVQCYAASGPQLVEHGLVAGGVWVCVFATSFEHGLDGHRESALRALREDARAGPEADAEEGVRALVVVHDGAHQFGPVRALPQREDARARGVGARLVAPRVRVHRARDHGRPAVAGVVAARVGAALVRVQLVEQHSVISVAQRGYLRDAQYVHFGLSLGTRVRFKHPIRTIESSNVLAHRSNWLSRTLSIVPSPRHRSHPLSKPNKNRKRVVGRRRRPARRTWRRGSSRR